MLIPIMYFSIAFIRYYSMSAVCFLYGTKL